MQGFVNWCHQTKRSGDLVTVSEALDYFVPRLPQGIHSIGHYLGSTAKDVLRDNPMPNRTTYADLLRVIWSDYRCKANPSRMPCFAFAADVERDGWVMLTDDDRVPLYVFDPDCGMGWFSQAA